VTFNQTPLKKVPGLAKATHLYAFNATNTGLTDIGALAGHDELTFVDLSDNPALVDIAALGKAKALRVLELEGTKVSSLAPLQACLALEILALRGTAVKDLAPLAKLPKLKQVLVPKDTPKAAVDALKKALPTAEVR
jgi:Leucine-rich repeat (LRR) protein